MQYKHRQYKHPILRSLTANLRGASYQLELHVTAEILGVEEFLDNGVCWSLQYFLGSVEALKDQEREDFHLDQNFKSSKTTSSEFFPKNFIWSGVERGAQETLKEFVCKVWLFGSLRHRKLDFYDEFCRINEYKNFTAWWQDLEIRCNKTAKKGWQNLKIKHLICIPDHTWHKYHFSPSIQECKRDGNSVDILFWYEGSLNRTLSKSKEKGILSHKRKEKGSRMKISSCFCLKKKK